MGKEEAKDKIKRNLWMRGFRVKDVSGLTGYDLLINSKYKVFVGYILPGVKLESIALTTAANCDVAAIFIPGEKPIIAYSREKKRYLAGLNQFLSFTRKPQEVFK